MPERGWVALTVRERVGLRIKEFARAQGLTVRDYLERLIATRPEARLGMGEGWVTCSLCGVRLKERNMQEHMAKVHPRPVDSQPAKP